MLCRAALSCLQIPANAIAAALQHLEADSDSEDGDGGFTEAGSMWGGDEVRRSSKAHDSNSEAVPVHQKGMACAFSGSYLAHVCTTTKSCILLDSLCALSAHAVSCYATLWCVGSCQDDDVSPEDAAALAAFMAPAALDGSGAAAQRTLADAIMAKINSAKQQQGADVQQAEQDVG